MRVLFVYKEKNGDNLFVPVIRTRLSVHGIEAISSVDEFWNPSRSYDIIHIHWPEEVVGWNVNDVDIDKRLETRLRYFKEKGSRVYYTCHNLSPHYGSPLHQACYRVVERMADCMVHLGNYSLGKMAGLYPDCRHVLIPHPIYLGAYDDTLTREAAREYWGIDRRTFVVTAFGKFRRRDEVWMTLKAFFSLPRRKKLLLAPRMLPGSYPKPLLSVIRCLLHLLGVRTENNERIISDEDLPYYFAVSDVVFVQRCVILNSGVVPMAFLFGRGVVGPDSGNVGELLRVTANLVFSPSDQGSVNSMLRSAMNMDLDDLGAKNRRYADKYLHPDKIAGLYAKCYHFEESH